MAKRKSKLLKALEILCPNTSADSAVRREEKRWCAGFRLAGDDPRLAVAALHRKLNSDRKRRDSVARSEAAASVDHIQQACKVTAPPRKTTKASVDRWCAFCKEERVDRKCEVCGRPTLDTAPTCAVK